MSAQAALVAATRALQAAGIDGAAGDARALLAVAMEVPRDRLTLHLGDDLDAAAAARLNAMIARRMAREPVAKIIGRRDFWGRSFEVTADVLDPRPETECLIAEALRGPVAARLLDLGTGSGIIAVTLLADWPGAQGVATDISAAALEVAARNAARHGVGARLDLYRSDWFSQVTGPFDLIVSNPPYIAVDEMPDLSPEVRDHDPQAALTDGADGLLAYRMIAAGAGAHLRPGGRIALEIGWQQGAQVRELLCAAGFAEVGVLPDLDGRDRVVVGVWPAKPGRSARFDR
ncbi:release factor glutamine methyltransferase [Roseovarius sp. A-2]|uniref:peptide chain release factor N(5)-glutamine methyltransferase n=1 Tax=Roseovarius sp. A-2 TaxID=1570360 RepID=UPI0009B50202|nr:peptide chain release factor N(5)-glutamine methyltransferase [Roseovarius sp. A-2]GAW36737.1 release factor glutamine methyltransferase [Roseovarius sp. A-2]